MTRMRQFASDLWNGRIPLPRVFWEYAIAYGTILNLLSTFASLAAFARNGPASIGLAIFFLPAPYNFLMIVAVWRSAARYSGPAIWPTLARATIILWAVAATFI